MKARPLAHLALQALSCQEAGKKTIVKVWVRSGETFAFLVDTTETRTPMFGDVIRTDGPAYRPKHDENMIVVPCQDLRFYLDGKAIEVVMVKDVA